MPKPSHQVLSVTKSGNRTIWQSVGAAFENRDGSINIVLNALPVNGRLQLRVVKPAPDGGSEGTEQKPAL